MARSLGVGLSCALPILPPSASARNLPGPGASFWRPPSCGYFLFIRPAVCHPQYLKELGPESHVPDHFGNFAIDFAPGAGAPPGVLGAWGPSAAATGPVDSTAQGAAAPTMLTSQLQHQTLESGPAGMAGGAAALQRAASEGVQQPARSLRARKGGAAAAAPSTGGRAASAASRGSRETKKEIDMKKHLALQEKNRRAQRRFRERQKQRVRGWGIVDWAEKPCCVTLVGRR